MSKEELNVVSNDPVESIDDFRSSDKKETKSDKEQEQEKSEKPETPEKSEKPEATEEEEAPPAPPRPVSPVSSMKKDLKDAFPSTDDRLITGILVASQGNMDSAFNALLYINDDSIEEPEIAVPAPAPAATINAKVSTQQELTDDELLARKLQKEFELEERRRMRRRKEKERNQQFSEDSGDEFEQLKDTFNQGLEDARTTLNGWVSGFAKKFDGLAEGEDDSQPPPKPPRKDNAKLFGALGGSSFNQKRSNKFDEDPEIIDNDFHQKINLNNNDPPKEKNWQPMSSEPVNSDAFMVDSDDDLDNDNKKNINL